MGDHRDLLRVMDERVALGDDSFKLVRGTVVGVYPAIRKAAVLLDGGTSPSSATYPAVPVAPIVPGDEVVCLRRKRDGWLLVGWVLMRDAEQAVIPQVDVLPDPIPARRGHLVMLRGAVGVSVADHVYLCRKDSSDDYVWTLMT